MQTRGVVVFVILAMWLSGCVWFGDKVLGEKFYVGGMTNPSTGEHITCGYVQKGEITPEQQRDLDTCVAEQASKGFVLDKSPSPQPSPPVGERE